MKRLALAWRLLRRDWRAGEMRILVLAVTVAVASITAVGFFTDRIGQLLALQANELLGGDLVIKASQPLGAEITQHAKAAPLRHTETVEFPSMVLAGEAQQLAAVKAVAPGYPLRGVLRVATALFAPDRETDSVPAPGEVWLESRLMAELGVDVGRQVSLGVLRLTVSAVLTTDPARASGNIFSIAPRLLMNVADLPATQLITPASRVRYSWLFAGDAKQVSAFRRAVAPLLTPGQRIQGIDDARPEVRNALDRASRFLSLAALVSVMLASVAVAMATRRYVSRHLDYCAIMRCLGAQQRTLLQLYLWQMIALALVASGIGIVVGYGAQFGLVALLASVAQVTLPSPSWWPAAIGLLTGVVTVLGFAFPPLLRLKNVPSLRVLRRDLGVLPVSSWATYGTGLVALSALVMWQAGNIQLGLTVLLGALGTVLLLAAVALLLMQVLGRMNRGVGVAWRFGIQNLTRRAQSSVVQIVAFGLGLLALLLLSIVRADLLADWMERIPDDAPNRFLINIQPDQVASLSNFLAAELNEAPTLYPMVRGRLVAVNGKPVSADDFGEVRAQRLVAREFNLSFGAELPPDNQVIEGSWWQSATADFQLSLEAGLAQELSLGMGDRLNFQIADRMFDAQVSNIRQVDWDNFRVNFFVIASPNALQDFPATYITSFYLSASQHTLLNRLLKQFPNVTVIDVAAIMTQVRSIIERVSQAVEYVFLFTLLAGLMVLYAAIQSTLDERLYETAILRTLGANRKQVLRGLMAEFALLGLLAGAVAAAAASAVGYVLASQVFELSYTFNPWLWLTGLVAGGVGVGVAGVLGTRPILARAPLQTLRAL